LAARLFPSRLAQVARVAWSGGRVGWSGMPHGTNYFTF